MNWDLEALYPSTKLWDEDFAKLEAAARNFAGYKGRLAESPAVFREAIEASDAFDRLSEKLYTYAHLRSDENTTIGVNRARVDRICAKLAGLSEMEAWFAPEVMAIPEERMAELLQSEELAFYRRSIEELLREKKHILSECEERLLGQLSDVLGTSGDLFSTLNDTDLRSAGSGARTAKCIRSPTAVTAAFWRVPNVPCAMRHSANFTKLTRNSATPLP